MDTGGWPDPKDPDSPKHTYPLKVTTLHHTGSHPTMGWCSREWPLDQTKGSNLRNATVY